MSGPTIVGRVIESALTRYESQPSVLQVVTGILMGVAVTAASLVVFRITLQILVDYFR